MQLPMRPPAAQGLRQALDALPHLSVRTRLFSLVVGTTAAILALI